MPGKEMMINRLRSKKEELVKALKNSLYRYNQFPCADIVKFLQDEGWIVNKGLIMSEKERREAMYRDLVVVSVMHNEEKAESLVIKGWYLDPKKSAEMMQRRAAKASGNVDAMMDEMDVHMSNGGTTLTLIDNECQYEPENANNEKDDKSFPVSNEIYILLCVCAVLFGILAVLFILKG